MDSEKNDRISSYNTENNYQYFPRQFLTGDGNHARCMINEQGAGFPATVKLPHMHGFFEIELVSGGNGTHIINAARYPLHRGMLHLIRPGDVHQYLFHGESIHMFTVQFDEAMIAPALVSEMSQIRSPLYCDTAGDAETLIGMLNMVADDPPQGHDYANSLLRCEIEILARYLLARVPHTIPSYSAPVRSALSYISIHYYKRLTLEMIAGSCSVTPEHLGRLFKAELGCSVPEYINRFRLQIASNLMRSTRYTLRQISAESGYQSYRHFAREFTSYYGAAPSGYRALIEQ